jgi:tetratricopeptide (TPR) repeat protein
MPRTVVSVAVALLTANLLPGQPPEAGPAAERPALHVPLRATTKAELDHLEAVTLCGLAALQEKQNRLVEASRTLEAARRLDPDAIPPIKALIPIYLALDRGDDALAGCRRVLEVNPDDCDIAYLYSRQLRVRGQLSEARAVLERAAASPAVGERLELEAQICFDLGVLCEDAADWPAAEKALRRVAAVVDNPAALMEQGAYSRDEIDGRAAETYERLGRICLKAGQASRAIEAFEKARKRDPLRAPRLSFNLAEVLLRERRPAEALTRVEEYLCSQPQGTEGYELKIKLQRELGRGAEVVPDLETAAGRDRHNTSLQLLLAREYRRAHEPEKAAGLYERLLADAPSPEAYQGLFALFKDRGGAGERILSRLDACLAAAAEKDDNKPGDANQAAQARAMLQALRGDADLVRQLLEAAGARLQRSAPMSYATRNLLGSLAARTQQLDVAEGLYRSCLPAGGGPRANEHEVYMGLLLVLQRAHKYKDIIDVCSQALDGPRAAQATNRVLFFLTLAEAHAALGHDKAAMEAIDAAVRDSDEKSRLMCRLTRTELLSGAGKHEQAETECRALLKEYNQPGDVRSIRYRLSGVYSAAGRHTQAEEQLLAILEEDPNDASAHNDLGYVWADQNKKLDEAERHIRQALALDREQRRGGTFLGLDADADSAAYVDSLGWVLFRRGRLEEARKELERATTLPTGDDPVIWDHLGDVCHRLKDSAGAAAAWRKAVALYEAGRRPKSDGRCDEIQQKLRLVEP